MRKQKYGCKKCQKTFILDVLDNKDYEKGLRGRPPQCPYCGSLNVVKI